MAKQTTDDDVNKFWQEREEKLGGTIECQSYATLIGESGSGSINGRGGLCYIVNDRFYFEDFERQNALMALFNRKDKDYEKTEISFELKDVQAMVKVSEKWGKACVVDSALEEDIDTLGGLRALFVRGYTLIQLKSRPSLIMEIMNDEEIKKRIVP